MLKMLKPTLSLFTLLLLSGVLVFAAVGCPADDDDDSSATDDDDATGDDDDATGDDDDATGDDDDATGDDDDSAGVAGSCLYERNGEVVACDQGTEDECDNDGGPKGVTVTWVHFQGCPAGQTASCTTNEPSPWFYYLDQSDDLLGPWCGRCASELEPSDWCDSVGDDDDSAGDDDDSAGDDDDSAGDDDDSAGDDDDSAGQ